MLDDARFTLSQVAAAAGIEVTTLRSWLHRRHWQLNTVIGDSPSDVAGRAHLITLRRALHIGAAAELVRNDIEPARAFKAAQSYVDLFDSTWERDGHPRGPDGLFMSGLTLLVAYPAIEHGVIMRVDLGQPVSETPLSQILFPPVSEGRQVSGTFVWLNQIDRRMRAALEGATA